MRYYKVGRSVFVSLLMVLSVSFVPNLPMVLVTSRVLAENTVEREAEADKFFNKGIQQFKANQFEAALQSFQKALIIFREIKNRKGEGWTLAGLGFTYFELQDYPKAIDYHKQSLAIAREVKDSNLEAYVQQGLVNAKLRSNPQKAKADRLLVQGIEQYQASKFTAALQPWEQALKIYREIKHRRGEGAALGGIGSSLLLLGRLSQSH